AISGYGLFFAALPFRFYCMIALALVLLTALWGRDFGPMLKAERRAYETGQLLRPGAQPLAAGASDVSPKDGVPYLARNAVIPVGLVLGLIVCATYLLGA